MVKKCNKADKINEYLDKKADLCKEGLSLIDAEFERHTEECLHCRAELLLQQELFDDLSGLEMIEPPPDFTAQLLARLPQQNRQKLPNWSLLAGVVILAGSSTALFAFIYWAMGLTQLDFMKTIFNSALSSVWEGLHSLFGEIADVAGLVWGWLKAFMALVQAYPVSFITAIAIAVLMFVVMARLIGAFQKENYA